MKTIKVIEATHIQLDWLVAKCEGREDPIYRFGDEPNDFYISGPAKQGPYYPSSNWAQAGPIMDQAEIDTYLYERGSPFGWIAEITGTKFKGKGPTRLIAVMRCYVTSKLGNEVEIPEEL